uniref:Uncharacterized protein n=1 Tax=Rhizophora mucronata TaxID=61149 RepID=A0A2P2K7U0_RHIMU
MFILPLSFLSICQSVMAEPHFSFYLQIYPKVHF